MTFENIYFLKQEIAEKKGGVGGKVEVNTQNRFIPAAAAIRLEAK